MAQQVIEGFITQPEQWWSSADKQYLEQCRQFHRKIESDTDKNHIRDSIRGLFYRNRNLSPDVFIEALAQAGLVQVFDSMEKWVTFKQQQHEQNLANSADSPANAGTPAGS